MHLTLKATMQQNLKDTYYVKGREGASYLLVKNEGRKPSFS